MEKKLTPEQYRVMKEKPPTKVGEPRPAKLGGGTEAPFSGKYWNFHEKGMYRCAACGVELFSSSRKFDSSTGWPSFTEPANLKNIELKEDTSYGMNRTEVMCKNCGSHLGHVFDDLPRRGKAGGPKEKGGKRYCINSVCLEFTKDKNQG